MHNDLVKVSHGSHLAVLEDETRFPFFYQMTPTEEAQYLGIVKLLLHFRWTWVGLFAQDNDNGGKFRDTLTALMLKSGICVAFSQSIPETGVISSWSTERKRELNSFLCQGQVNAFVFFGYIQYILMLEKFTHSNCNAKVAIGKVWIATLLLDSLYSLACGQFTSELPMHGSLSIVPQTKKGMRHHFLQACSPLIQEFTEKAFDLIYLKSVFSGRDHLRYREKERLEGRPWEVLKEELPPRAYNVYTSVHAVARALHAAYSSRSERVMRVRGDRLENDLLQPWQVSISSELRIRHLSFGPANVEPD
ncbi:UNVERIFIED_CONTAM: hypothetical protein K2H54_064069 [Gekko kuhli]